MAYYTVILDACVMYPAPLRSYLLYLTQTGLFRSRWTAQIHDEWTRNLIKNRPDLDQKKLQRTRDLMDAHFPDCLVEGYEPIIDNLQLPDVDDRHVLAAAIRGQAEAIITFNLKDFPANILEPFGIQAIHPDEFLSDMYELKPSDAIKAAQHHRASLKNPSLSADEYLDCLQRQRLPNFVSQLRQLSVIL